MRVSRGNIESDVGKAIVTIGMFDGVHRGHMSLINSVVSKARASGGESVAVTFDPHPRIVISGGDINLKFLTSMEEKIYLLEKTGLDHLLILPFNDELRKMGACDFVENILIRKVGLSYLVVGFDHHFGHKGGGDNTTLAACAEKLGFGITRVGALLDGHEAVSSTVIRECLQDGNLEKANSLLGYDYILHGRVVEGMKIGRSIGYPTANIEPCYDFKLVPADGVYAVETCIGDKRYKSMLYIGTRPTLENGGKRVIEVNMFGFDGDIYGANLSIIFRYHIREDIRFLSKELLREQIARDKEAAIRLLG